jgi:uncharacterized protein (TIGR03663 family)
MSKPVFRALALVILTGALVFRTVGLGRRPMHHDEANQAVKFGDLLERGDYRYDRNDHHGPSLYYLTLPLARAAGRHTLVALDEGLLRLLPALFGAGTVLVLLLFPGLGKTAGAAAGLLAAVSPVAIYYSRFYIQESLFVFFAVAFLLTVRSYIPRPSAGRAILAGAAAGMMVATKETSVIILAAAAGAFFLARRTGDAGDRPAAGRRRFALDAGLAIAACLAVAGLFFSSFFRNPRGILDSVLAFGTYFARGAGEGFHNHPWTYYLKTLAFSRAGFSAPVWTEGMVLALALIGGVAALRIKKNGAGGRSPGRFIFFYTILATAAFSVIPYKTPWNLLPFYAGFFLLAGLGVEFLLKAARSKFARFGMAALFLAGIVHLGIQSYRANFVYDSDPRNPYAYAQTSRDYLRLIQRVDELGSLRPEGRRMLIQVFASPYETWPLPWSLRGYTNVGYWTNSDAPGSAPGSAPVMITSADEASKLGPRLGSQYHVEYYGLRPEVILALHVREDLWDRFLAGKAPR